MLLRVNRMRAIALVLFCVAVAIARASMPLPRIVGGSVTTINNYPEITALLYAPNGVHFSQWCGGSILNQRSVLTAAHCFDDGRNVASRWRFRVGSSFAHSGGVTHNTAQIIRHPNYNSRNWDSDVAIIRSSSNVQYNNNVRAARIAGANYNLADNQVVWAAGWGVTETGWSSEQLRHVQVWTINQAICRQRYGAAAVTDNMLCSGWLDVGGRDQCGGDSGGPLYHNGIVVGICSWGSVQCAHSFYPGVNARVTRFTQWIQANA